MKRFYSKAHSLLEQHDSFVAVTLVDIWLSAPQEVGAKMLVTNDGLAEGTVGGGKVEAAAIQLALDLISCNQGEKLKLVNW